MTGPRVVVIGAGIVGTSLADELTGRGWADVTVLDRGPLPAAGGSSSHAPGLVFATNPSETLSRFAQYTIEKFERLSAESDRLCFNAVGGLEVATTPARMTDLHRKAGWARAWGVPARIVDAAECARLHPMLDTTTVLGGLHTPTDGLADALACVEVQRARAESAGARFLGDTRVTGIATSGDRVTGVVTQHGLHRADVVVSCAGFWGVEIGEMVGLTVPLVAMGHQYVTTTPVDAARAFGDARTGRAAAALPILRHQDADLYYRQHGDRIGIGYYGHPAMPVDMDRLYRDTRSQPMPSMLPFTPDDFAPAWTESTRVLPDLAGASVADGFNGIFSFTPDGGPVLGTHPDLDGFWVAEAVWVTQSAGVARTMAHWLIDGTPDLCVAGCDIARFSAREIAPDHIAVMSARAFDEVYDIIHPREQRCVQRDLTVSPLHDRHRDRGAVFATSHDWERPAWFEANATLPPAGGGIGGATVAGHEFSTRHWSPIVLAEAAATRAGVGLFDMTSLMRVEVTGPDAVAFLAPLLTRDPDRAVGTVIYALMLDSSGGVLSDVTVARTATDRFQIGVNGPLDLSRLVTRSRIARRDGCRVEVREITSETACLGVWGPAALALVDPLCADRLDADALGFYRTMRTRIADVDVLAMRVSYVGEFGWELYVATDDAGVLADELTSAGAGLGAVWAGRGALDTLRIEKGYRSWGADMSAVHTPDEAGLAFAVAKNHDFVGRAAISRQPVRRRLHTLVADDPDTILLGHEPATGPDGTVGHVTSAAFSPTLHRTIAYAWGAPEMRVGDRVLVDHLTTTTGFTVSPTISVDPENARLKGRPS